jgi:hypothetical protein
MPYQQPAYLLPASDVACEEKMVNPADNSVDMQPHLLTEAEKRIGWMTSVGFRVNFGSEVRLWRAEARAVIDKLDGFDKIRLRTKLNPTANTEADDLYYMLK